MFKIGFGRSSLLFLFLLLGYVLAAQSHSDSLPWRLATSHKTDVEQKLSHPKVNVIHQDRLGFIWIGTDYGLNRYDGHQVQNFYLDQDELSSNRITHILEDAQGFFWLIEAYSYYETCLKVEHISFWDPFQQRIVNEEQIFQEQLPFTWKEVQHFFQSKDGQLFFYLKQKESWTYTLNRRFERLDLPKDFFPIQSSLNNGLWGQLGTQVMELSLEGANLRSFKIVEGTRCQRIIEGFQEDVHYKSHSVRAQPIPMATNPLGWYTGLGEGLPETIQSFLTSNRSVLHIDREKQRYWVYNGKWRPYDKNGNLLIPPDQLTATKRAIHLKDYLFDAAGMIWDDTPSGIVIQKLELDYFERYLDAPKGINNSPYKVRGVMASEDKMLVGTFHGNQLVNFSSGNTEPLSIKDQRLARSTFISFVQENDSTAWAFNHRLLKINTQDWTLEKEVEMPTIDIPGMKAKIWGAFQAKSGKLWMKKQAYLLSYDPQQSDTVQIFRKYNGFDELETELVYHFYENEKGIWLATYKGLFLLDEEKGIIEQYSSRKEGPHFLPADRIHYIHPDTGSWFWLATADLGLVHWNYETGAWSHLSRREGLPSNNLYTILPDKQGFFWISSEDGLIRLHPNRKNFNLFFTEHGLPINEFNRMAYFKGEDNYFYFGGQQGVVRFKAEQFNEAHPYCPDLSIAKGLIYNERGQYVRSLAANNQRKQKIYLKSHEKRIDLDFSLQDYFQSNRQEYWYRSTKSEDDWIKLRDNQLSLGGFAYGKNKFRVRAIQADGKIADNVMMLSIFQQAPLYLRWWFLLSVALVLVYLIYYYTQWRTKKYQQQQKLLEQEVAKRIEQINKDQIIIQTQAAALKALDSGFVEQIDQLILQNLNNTNFSVEELAKAAGISRSQLHRKLKNAVQQTPSRRIRQLRLQKAKDFLSNSSLSIAEIAFQCGFQDANYFSRLFKQEFDLPATDYREKKSS